MSRLASIFLFVPLLTVGCARNHGASQRSGESIAAERSWITGTWESVRLSYGDFWEWRGASKLQLIAHDPDRIDLVLVYPDGRRCRAYDSWPSQMHDAVLFFGDLGSGLKFHFTRSKDILTLRLDGSTPIEATMRRVGPPPSHPENLPNAL